MIKKQLVLCALALSASPAFAHAAGITLSQTSGTSSDVYYIPTSPIKETNNGTQLGIFRPDGSLIDLVYDSAVGFECMAGGFGTSTSGFVDISLDLNINTCKIQGPNPYGTYTFVEAPRGHGYLDGGCVWENFDPTKGHVFPNNLSECIESMGPSVTYTTYDWLPPDVTAPIIAPSADLTVEATSSTGAIVSYSQPAATDDRDGTVPVSCTPASGSLFAIGTTTVTCMATDSSGNAASATFKVRVKPAPISPISVPAISVTRNGSITITLPSIVPIPPLSSIPAIAVSVPPPASIAIRPPSLQIKLPVIPAPITLPVITPLYFPVR